MNLTHIAGCAAAWSARTVTSSPRDGGCSLGYCTCQLVPDDGWPVEDIPIWYPAPFKVKRNDARTRAW